MNILKLMPDYQCFPLWDMSPKRYEDIDPAALPISELLCNQLMEWAQTYDLTLDEEDPLSSGFRTGQERDAFVAEGVRLAKQLTEELGSNFIVETRFQHISKQDNV